MIYLEVPPQSRRRPSKGIQFNAIKAPSKTER